MMIYPISADTGRWIDGEIRPGLLISTSCLSATTGCQEGGSGSMEHQAKGVPDPSSLPSRERRIGAGGL